MYVHQKDEINGIIDDALKAALDRIHNSIAACTKDGIVRWMAQEIKDGVDKLEVSE